jgi:hypothetical protein
MEMYNNNIVAFGLPSNQHMPRTGTASGDKDI